MAQPVMVRGGYNDTYLLLLVLGIAFAGAGCFAGTQVDSPAATVGGGALAAVFAALLYSRYGQLKRRRIDIEPGEAGFRVTDHTGEGVDYADDDLLSIALADKPRLSNGKPNGVNRRGSLILADGDGTRTVDIRYAVSAKGDPLGPLFDRLLANLAERSWSHFEGGGKLPGLGWELNREGLLVQDKKGITTLVEHGNLAAISIVDGRVTVWEKENPYPSVKIPVGEMNAQVLHAMLVRKLSDTPTASKEGTGPDGLGRVLFERKTGISFVLRALLILLGGLFVLLGGGLIVTFMFRQAKPGDIDPIGGYLIFGGLFFFGILLLIAGLNGFAKSFRVQEFGVRTKNALGPKTLKFADVEILNWKVTRHYFRSMHTAYQPVYTGTTLAAKLRPAGGSGLPTISYSQTLKGMDEELDKLRDVIAQAIARRMLERVRAGEAVKWTGDFTFEPKVLRGGRPLAKAGFPDGLPYGEMYGPTFEDGTFYIFAHGKKKSVVSLSTGAANFYPGFFLLVAILAGREAAPKIQIDGERDGAGDWEVLDDSAAPTSP